MREKKREVFCEGCANLFIVPGMPPQCVATAQFVSGPLRKEIDVEGRVPAERRNLHNDCAYRKPISFRAYRLKRWLLWRMNNEGRLDQFREVDLKQYPVQTEWERTKAYYEREEDYIAEDIDHQFEEEVDSFIEQLKEEDSAEEELLDKRGTDSTDLHTYSSEGSGWSGEDTEHADRRERESGDQDDAGGDG